MPVGDTFYPHVECVQVTLTMLIWNGHYAMMAKMRDPPHLVFSSDCLLSTTSTVLLSAYLTPPTFAIHAACFASVHLGSSFFYNCMFYP